MEGLLVQVFLATIVRSSPWTDELTDENYNFKGAKLRLVFHEEPGIVSSPGNDTTQLTGLFGELWTCLAEYRNFTLVPKKVREKAIGLRPTLSSPYTGMMKYLEEERADIIPRMEVFLYWTDVVDYFMPLWNDRFRLFLQVSYEENTHWLARLFSPGVWLSIAGSFALFASVCYSRRSGADHLFYLFGALSQRSHHLFELQPSRRYLNTLVCLFSMLVLDFYGARIIHAMVNKVRYAPFDDLITLHNNTKLVVIAETDTIPHASYNYLRLYKDVAPKHELRPIIRSRRIEFSQSREMVHAKACSRASDYVIFESENLKRRIVVNHRCKFEPLGEAYYPTWIASGIRKDFKHRRSIDLGILKLFESGIFNALKLRLIGFKDAYGYKEYKLIDLKKVYVVVKIYEIGVCLALVLLVLENVAFMVQKRREQKARGVVDAKVKITKFIPREKIIYNMQKYYFY